ncbi:MULTISPECIES: sensor histidine kinase [unclassified Streptomyces]|uniref:sensor histidine kinase n=1 Tax=unclassified Streptomyces TaxID=2593676 RepID=UPI0022514DDF|nr:MULTISPECIES: histidine kinase [unclassified Streptomyces]MCX4881310.1 histidine kinase [Streptomyces sp. NBC_00847]MCX5421360.1 histidine kinase [Streptomyces sp. NBC_00078]
MTTTGEDHAAARGGPWWWVSWRGAALDVGLAVASAVECAFEGVRFARDAGIPVAAGVVFGVVAGSALLVRRQWPIAVVLVSIAITPAQMGYLMGIVGLYTLAASELPRRIIASLAGMSLVGMLIVMFVRVRQDMARGTWDLGDWFVPFAAITTAIGMTAPPLLLGLYVGARRRLMESLRERADSLERELQLLAERAEERAEWARNEERTRIAREMHDVVAHRVSLMVVHAAALQAVARKDPEKAVRNAALVGDMGRQALTELREMLGVLRSADGVRRREQAVPLAAVGVAAAVAASKAVDEGEGPCLSELEELVGQSAAAGMVVDLSVEGDARVYAAEVEQTAYRVVQEALTNVHKHAAGAKTQVRLAHRVSEIAMQVENGPPPEVSSASSARLPSGGNGLVGMKERVSALGGVFVSGPTDAGGFRVSAVIPAA